MIVFDTDTLSLLLFQHPKVVERFQESAEEISITLITRIETLRGRFDTLMKAASGKELQFAFSRLVRAEQDLAKFRILPIDANIAAAFDRLREDKKLRKIGRADLLIASIALARKATLVTRNLKHFRQVPGLAVDNWAD